MGVRWQSSSIELLSFNGGPLSLKLCHVPDVGLGDTVTTGALGLMERSVRSLEWHPWVDLAERGRVGS